MRQAISSRIMRTTIDLDPSILSELRRRSQGEGKSMGRLASELLAQSLQEARGARGAVRKLTWISRDLGRPRVDLEDKEALRSLLDGSR